MAIIKPFKAWKPDPSVAQHISCVPYDVVNTQEAKLLAQGKENSFLHVIRPEIGVLDGVSIYDDAVYQTGRDNLNRLLQSNHFSQDDEEQLYIYEISWKEYSQTGVFGCVSVKDYDQDIILKHELTRPDKEDDRTKHILTQQAHAEPVMLTFQDDNGIDELIKETTQTTPIFDFIADDGVSHKVWEATNKESLVLAFSDIPKFYIADGHHRCASATRAAHFMESENNEHNGKEEYNFFPAVLFPKKDVNILAYNRVIYDLPENFFELISSKFDLIKDADPSPSNKGNLSLYIDGTWFGLSLPESTKNDAASQLDVARLQEFILEPLLAISNQRTDKNINFIGGIRGVKELEKLVDSGQAKLGISLYPTSILELKQVSDAGLLMPPKSTWFEPKLRSGLLIHTF